MGLLIMSNKYKKNKLKNDSYVPRMFVVLAIIFGVTFSILIPLYQIPDEGSHFLMIYDSIGIEDNFFEQAEDYGENFDIIINYDNKVDADKYFSLSNKFELKDRELNFSFGVIKHFPQVIGLLISNFLELPIIVGVTLTEIISLLFYIFICYIALKIVPFKKTLLMFVMLLPMSVQQMASVSYDVVLLSFCYLFISYVLYLKYSKKKIILSDVVKLILILLVIGFVKIPYILLGLLITLLPFKKIDIKFFGKNIDINFLNKYKKNILIVLGTIFLLGLFVLYLKRDLLLSNDMVKIIISFISVPIDSILLLVRTVGFKLTFYIDSLIGSFGWLDTPTPKLFRIIVLLNLFVVSFVIYNTNNIKNNNKFIFKKWEKIVIYLTGLLLFSVLIISMFGWSLEYLGLVSESGFSIAEGINFIRICSYIEGVQGRYLIPLVFVFLLPVQSDKFNNLINKINIEKYLFVYYFIIYIYMFSIIYARYW